MELKREPDFYKLRNGLAELGEELTPDQLEEEIERMIAQIGPGNCMLCDKFVTEREFGLCQECRDEN